MLSASFGRPETKIVKLSGPLRAVTISQKFGQSSRISMPAVNLMIWLRRHAEASERLGTKLTACTTFEYSERASHKNQKQIFYYGSVIEQ